MLENEFVFKKFFISKNTFWNFKNIVCYEISKEEEIIARIEINSTFTAKIDYNSHEYFIRPLTRFSVLRKLEIFSSENLKIGEIDYWRWTWLRPKISIYDKYINENWEFDKNAPSFFKNRKNTYTTFLNDGNKIISYEIKLGSFFEDNNKNDCLKELNGIIRFSGNSNLILILGVYLNELLVFEEMEK
ncbi:hypothetical protein [Flavobacterium ajazii]|uniref:hypothetical protein n=1 Tax=Flavobacterium ajazii TaxID=2692318 RepID=UPI0013D62C4F|nr:hypothetical protein [Flavobacterium ajazii]